MKGPWIALAAGAALIASCGLGEGGDEEEAKPSPSAPKLVGRVATVHSTEGFVLVEGYGDHTLGEGLVLSGLGADGRTSSLRVTGERMGRFAAADLQSGEVRVGDVVYARVLDFPEEAEAPAERASPGDGSPSP